MDRRGDRIVTGPTAAGGRRQADPVVAALRPGGLGVAFQPIVRLADRSLIAVEAIARPADGTPPRTLFEAARAAGRVGPLNARLGDAVAAAALLLPPAPVCVNAAAGEVLPLLRRIAPVAQLVVVEIDETAPVARPEEIAEAVAAHGAALAFDDLPIGQERLALAPVLQPVLLKVDRSLMAGARLSRNGRAALGAYLALLRRIGDELPGGSTIAVEGAEDEADLALLAALDDGRLAVQGYAVARPMSAELLARRYPDGRWPAAA
jgi:EAL domain-containing protein (putative c-di-GMP-specific phosphodiesterase class I)